MPCYKPLTGWRSEVQNESGKYPLVFSQPPGKDLPQIEVACGRCIGCRLEYSRQWAMRIMHESQLHEDNAFITLTYNDENLPQDENLDKREWQLFLKKFRKSISPKKIRFFMAGEYGEQNQPPKKFGRPHYHAIIFNWFPEPNDITAVQKSASGEILYNSEYLSKIWGKGFVSVGSVTFESAGYVARYVTKKITGELAENHYKDINTHTGEIFNLQPEFTLSSRRPGLAHNWFKKFKTDLDKGFITVRGKKMNAAKYYDKLMEKDNPEQLEYIKDQRTINALNKSFDNTDERLKVKETIKRKKLKLLPRGTFKNDN